MTRKLCNIDSDSLCSDIRSSSLPKIEERTESYWSQSSGSQQRWVVFFETAVLTLFKKANLDHEVLANYRPFSNLKPVISKIIEKVVAVRLQKYLEPNQLNEPLPLPINLSTVVNRP